MKAKKKTFRVVVVDDSTGDMEELKGTSVIVIVDGSLVASSLGASEACKVLEEAHDEIAGDGYPSYPRENTVTLH